MLFQLFYFSVFVIVRNCYFFSKYDQSLIIVSSYVISPHSCKICEKYKKNKKIQKQLFV